MIGAQLFGQQTPPQQQPQQTNINAMSILDLALKGGIKQSPPPPPQINNFNNGWPQQPSNQGWGQQPQTGPNWGQQSLPGQSWGQSSPYQQQQNYSSWGQQNPQQTNNSWQNNKPNNNGWGNGWWMIKFIEFINFAKDQNHRFKFWIVYFKRKMNNKN